jgi:hypothetical protein
MKYDQIASVTCNACRARFDRSAWASLALVRRIEPVEVRRLMRDWPLELCIEIRRCPRCAREIPAKRDALVAQRRLAG